MSNIGFSVSAAIKRPSKELIENLRNVPVACIADNMNRMFAMDREIKPYGRPSICGPAYTVKAPAGDNLMFHHAIDACEAGDVLVIAGVGHADRSFCGEIMVQIAKLKGIEGFLIDGLIRDAEGIAASDFAVYARGVQPNGPYKHGPGMMNTPVACGGQVVFPGDIIVGDTDGVIVIPAEYAEEVYLKALKQAETEDSKLIEITENGTIPSREWIMKALQNGNCDFM